ELRKADAEPVQQGRSTGDAVPHRRRAVHDDAEAEEVTRVRSSRSRDAERGAGQSPAPRSASRLHSSGGWPMSNRVVVIGGGGVGSCSAYYLGRGGWKVTV